MRCDRARYAISLVADGEPPGQAGAGATALDEHLESCQGCRRFRLDVERIRSGLRVEPVDAVPDVAPAVIERLRAEGPGHRAVLDLRRSPTRRRTVRPGRPAPVPDRPPDRHRLVVPAAAVAGLIAGAAFVGFDSEPRFPAAADLPARVQAAQREIRSLQTRFELAEHGLSGKSASRVFDGTLRFAAPESLELTLRLRVDREPDRDSDGEPGVSSPGDVRLSVDESRWELDAVRPCQTASGRECPAGDGRWVQSGTGREPFATSLPNPLELVSPVDSFTLASAPATLGSRTIAERPAIGVTVPAAQVATLLDGLSPAGDLRAVHPTDPTDLWLDAESFVPLDLVVRAADGVERARWAKAHQYEERAGDTVISAAVLAVRINAEAADMTVEPPSTAAPPTARLGPGASHTVDAGFAEGDPSWVPEPTVLPDGFDPYRKGQVSAPGGPTVGVRSWTDGRAWLTVRATSDWTGDRLFGDLGPLVRTLDLEAAGLAYASESGDRVALHTDRLDVVVSGSLAPNELYDLAASLGIVGEPVPAHWDQADVGSLRDAAMTVPDLLTLGDSEEFGPPAVRIADASVTQGYAGPGDRGVVLTQTRSERLPPPPDADLVGVRVRGVTGRYSLERGELEWIEAGSALSLRSGSLALAELLRLAESLEAAR